MPLSFEFIPNSSVPMKSFPPKKEFFFAEYNKVETAQL